MKKSIFLVITIIFVNQHLFASFPVSKSISAIVANDCDIILLKSGEEILANVLEITPDLIKYKKCDLEKGPLISISKASSNAITNSTTSNESAPNSFVKFAESNW